MLIGVFVLIAVVVVVAILPTGPLAMAIERKREDVAHKTLLLETARKHVAEIQGLKSAGATRTAADGRTAIERVLARTGIPASPGASPNGDGQTAIVIGNASFDDVVRAIDTLAREEALYLVDGTISGLVERGRVRADLVFAR